MKAIRQLLNRVLHDPKRTPLPFAQRYPEYQPLDGKRHVYYVAALLNPSGYYRMLLPALELNRTSTHAAIIGQVHRWNFTKTFHDYDLTLDAHLVRWADDVVIPVMTTDASYMVDMIRSVNPKARIIMDIDVLYHALPDTHPAGRRITQQHREHVLLNLHLADLITAPSHYLLDDYHRLLTTRFQTEPHLAFLPNLLSSFTYEEVDITQQSGHEKLRIGLLADATQEEDVALIQPVLHHLAQTYGDQVEIIRFGSKWVGATDSVKPGTTKDEIPGKSRTKSNASTQGIIYAYHRSVPILDFHKTFHAFGFDLLLLPALDHRFNTRKSFLKYLEGAALGIPMMASDVIPYREIIFDRYNGLLAKDKTDWINGADELINDPLLREQLGANAREFAWRELSYNKDAVHILQSTFSP